MEDTRLELIDEDGECKKILMKGTENFGMIFSTCLRPKNSKFPNLSVGNIDIYLPFEIFDKIVDMLGKEYLSCNVTDSDILKIDDKITLIKNEDPRVYNDKYKIVKPKCKNCGREMVIYNIEETWNSGNRVKIVTEIVCPKEVKKLWF